MSHLTKQNEVNRLPSPISYVLSGTCLSEPGCTCTSRTMELIDQNWHPAPLTALPSCTTVVRVLSCHAHRRTPDGRRSQVGGRRCPSSQWGRKFYLLLTYVPAPRGRTPPSSTIIHSSHHRQGPTSNPRQRAQATHMPQRSASSILYGPLPSCLLVSTPAQILATTQAHINAYTHTTTRARHDHVPLGVVGSDRIKHPYCNTTARGAGPR